MCYSSLPVSACTKRIRKSTGRLRMLNTKKNTKVSINGMDLSIAINLRWTKCCWSRVRTYTRRLADREKRAYPYKALFSTYQFIPVSSPPRQEGMSACFHHPTMYFLERWCKYNRRGCSLQIIQQFYVKYTVYSIEHYFCWHKTKTQPKIWLPIIKLTIWIPRYWTY